MLVSFNWLKQYVDLPDSLTPEELALKLTMSTVEVEGVKKQVENLENIVVGKVMKIEKHPDADKLKVCKVGAYGNTPVQPVQCVCGGSNVREGMLVAFAKVGAKVRWHGEGELVELKPAKIRSVDSFGMICASTEIGLGEVFPLKDEKEILDLTSVIASGAKQSQGIATSSRRGVGTPRNDSIIGKPLSEALGLNDVIFEIDNKSMTHRPDLWGHYGLAREIAVLYGKKLVDYKTKEIKKLGNYEIRKLKKKVGTGLNLSVRVEEKKLCPRYMAVAIDGVKIGPSPIWMQKLLTAVGLRPINNIVDITNYILLDLGQPMHAFDNSKLKTQNSKVEIIVRRAKEGEKFKTLDGQEHKLTNEMLVIADEKKPIALAGVMGGENSEINDKTTTIIYESATFDAASVRKTALKLGLRTESSARFEKSLDPNNAELALQKALEFTLEFCPGARIASQVADEKNFHLNQGPIEMSLEFLNKKIGIIIEKKKVAEILKKLGFGVKEKKNDIFSVTVPSWRATKDISLPEDLVEEVARIYGYGKIEPKLPDFPITPPERNELRVLERKIKNILSLEFGFSEVYNYSFVSGEVLQKLGEDVEKYLELANPLAKDRPYLRRGIWPGLLDNAEKNLHRFDKIKLFEIGKVFTPEQPGLRVSEKSDELLPRQDLILSAVYAEKGMEVPFYELSQALSGLLCRLGYQFSLESAAGDERKELITHHGRGAIIKISGVVVGAVAELHPTAQKNLGLESRVASLEINLNKLLVCKKQPLIYQRLPDYPSVTRDIAFVADKKLEQAKIVVALKKVDKLIMEVELFDVFEGKNLGAGKKSLAYHLIYQSPERTLTAEEVDRVQAKVVKIIEKEFAGEVRM